MIASLPYRHVIAADTEFEFGGNPGNRQRPVCIVAKDLRTGQTWRRFRGEFDSRPPFPTGPDALFVAFYASAELGFFKALDWPMPANVLDLFAEFRCRTNTTTKPLPDAGLIDALSYFGLDTIGATYKQNMIDLILCGPPWTEQERADIFEYCAGDVAALERLLPAMLPAIDLPRALLRGRYMKAAAAIEWNGVPIDAGALELLRARWADIQDDLIAEIDSDYGVFDGRKFKADRFDRYLAEHGIPWPRLNTGRLDLGDGTFRQMAKAHPRISKLRELRSSLSELRLNDLQVGGDGRNRALLSAFRSRTGRNQPSNAKFIFGPAVWLRSLIKPPAGCGVAYIDWSQQEFGIAAALSGDPNMMRAYLSGDPYLEFAKQAGAVPSDATKNTHKPIRELYKQAVLATQYGMEWESLSARIGQPTVVARELLRAHRETFRVVWRWSDAVLDYAMTRGTLHTSFGWCIRIAPDSNPRTLRNFPMQSNGSEMMRLAACYATEGGIEVCAPVHDAFLICAPLNQVEHDIAAMRAAMAQASRDVLGGFELRTDVSRVLYPNRYSDERGAEFWDRVIALIGKRIGKAVAV
jgi:DNA polymerase I